MMSEVEVAVASVPAVFAGAFGSAASGVVGVDVSWASRGVDGDAGGQAVLV
ncbi:MULTISPECIES: hypothetical protein [Gordonia]|jgi:hypothetical protein|uniref:hypothetical protein n=1 Tax=Gordonia TaxID=2053 RepID=UPI000344EDD6|nr:MULTISPECIES: hypothetical protein [Gordonia]WFN95095.1 hypothetical protein P5P27_20180 [Gordonia sihwensis]